MKPAYYNEFDPYAAEWLRNLIKKGLIPDGDVDDRSIVDVQPEDLRGYGQRHLFAGIGGWAYACRLAGYPDDADIITGSPPCQPFSVAGRQRGVADDRHLWPEMARLVASLRPAAVAVENVANIVGVALDGMLSDLEGAGYASRAFVIPACAVDAPHRRDRVWIAARSLDGSVVHSESVGRGEGRAEHEVRSGRSAAPGTGGAGSMANSGGERRCRGQDTSGSHDADGSETGRSEGAVGTELLRQDTRGTGPVGDSCSQGLPGGQLGGESGETECRKHTRPATAQSGCSPVADTTGVGRQRGKTGEESPESGKIERLERFRGDGHGFWSNSEWISGADGKVRRIPESGVRELAPGVSAGMAGLRPIPLLSKGVPQRVSKLKALGNAICPQVAEQILRSIPLPDQS